MDRPEDKHSEFPELTEERGPADASLGIQGDRLGADTRAKADPPTSGENTLTDDPATSFELREGLFSIGPMPKTLHWSIPWSDLMMTMFILFAVMYIYQAANRPFLQVAGLDAEIGDGLGSGTVIGEGGGGLGDPQGMTKVYDLSKHTLGADDLRSIVSVELVSDRAVRIILTGDVLFDTGRADLKSKAAASLKRIASVIRQTPYMVNVVGHTDNVPIHSETFQTNWELSVARACVVCRFMIEQMGIPAERFYVSGHALYQPVKPNDNDENRAANRRVEIIISKERPYGEMRRVSDIAGTDAKG
jgi:chemotaxis protein MotB